MCLVVKRNEMQHWEADRNMNVGTTDHVAEAYIHTYIQRVGRNNILVLVLVCVCVVNVMGMFI